MEEQPSQDTMDEGVTNGETPAAYAGITCQPAALTSVVPSASVLLSPDSQLVPPIIFLQPSDQHQIVHRGVQHANLQQQLQAFWSDKLFEINETTKFNLNCLPLKRIKKIMKTDEDIQKISDDAPVLLAKACEMFIQELTLRAWHHTKQNNRRILQRKDISVALATTDVFDFLVDISPLNKLEPEGAELLADPLVPPPPEVKIELKGNDMGLLRMNSVQPTPIVLQGNAANLALAPPPTTNKVMPNLHLENFKPVQNYMGSSPRMIDQNQVPLCTMDVDSSPLLAADMRDWSELPFDALSSIFMKLGTIEILMVAGFVCHSWLAAAKAPELWRFLDMTRHKLVFSKSEDTMCDMAKVAIDRSEGQMESFWAQKFVTNGLLDYIASRANSLKSIRLIGCPYAWTESLARVAAMCPLLEEIECSYDKLPTEFFRYLGSVRPQLKRLRIHMQWYDHDQMMREFEMGNRQNYEDEYEEPEESDEAWEARQNEDAFAIAESLHELRVLQMAGNQVTNIGVYAIVEGCPNLECLSISSCYHVDVNDQLKARCARLKHVWLPSQDPYVRCPDLRVIGEHEGEDLGLTTIDLWKAEAESLCVEGEMDNEDYYGECDCGLTTHDLWKPEVESLHGEAEMDNNGSYGEMYWDDY